MFSFDRSERRPVWTPGSVVVEPNPESDEPRWLLFAFKGKWKILAAGGPMATIERARELARKFNDADPARWDFFSITCGRCSKAGDEICARALEPLEWR